MVPAEIADGYSMDTEACRIDDNIEAEKMAHDVWTRVEVCMRSKYPDLSLYNPDSGERQLIAATQIDRIDETRENGFYCLRESKIGNIEEPPLGIDWGSKVFVHNGVVYQPYGSKYDDYGREQPCIKHGFIRIDHNDYFTCIEAQKVLDGHDGGDSLKIQTSKYDNMVVFRIKGLLASDGYELENNNVLVVRSIKKYYEECDRRANRNISL